MGKVYIKTNEYSRKGILRDLVEMCRGVQHPLRGLFLKNCLLKCTKNVLPDQLEAGQFAEGQDPGKIDDSIDFIVVVYCHMDGSILRHSMTRIHFESGHGTFEST